MWMISKCVCPAQRPILFMFSVEKIPPSSVHPCSSNPLEDDLPRRIILDPKSLVSIAGVFLFQFPFFRAVCRDFIVYILSPSQEIARRDHLAQDTRDNPARPFIQFLSIVAGKLYPEQVVLSQPYDAQLRTADLIGPIGVEEITGKCIQGLHEPDRVHEVRKHHMSPMGNVQEAVAELNDPHIIRVLGCNDFKPMHYGNAQPAFQGNRPFYFLDGSFKTWITVEQIVKRLHA
jgi:hypothetical protein